MDGMLLHKYTFSWPVNSLFPSAGDPTSFYGTFISNAEHLQYCEFGQFSLEKDYEKKVSVKILLQGIPANSKHFALGCKGSYFAFIPVKQVKQAYTVKIFRLKKSQIYEIELEQGATCLACHPTENIVAVGCKTGKIVLWYVCSSIYS
jgi:hypothetical protein